MKTSLITVTALVLTLLATAKTSYLPLPDTLTPFRVVYMAGDDASERAEIVVFKKGDRYVAENAAPQFYIGKNKVDKWRTELNAAQIAACIQFQKKAGTLPAECPEVSLATKTYQITANNKTTTIQGDCDWEGIDFFDLRSALFSEYYAQLDARRRAFTDSLSSLLNGKWYFAAPLGKPEPGSRITLQKKRDKTNSCFWEMGKNSSFKSTCNEYINLSYSIRYALNTEGNIFFEIQGGTTTDAEGNTSIRNFGATYVIESVDEQELKLKFLRR